MDKNIICMIIKKETVEKSNLPKGIENFIIDSFEEISLFADKVYIACGTEDEAPWHEGQRDYTEGLPEEYQNDTGVWKWIHDHKEIIFRYDSI